MKQKKAATWQENLKRVLDNKEVVILHGNVRDTAYISEEGLPIKGLSELLRRSGRDLDFDRIVFWGVFFDKEQKGHSPIWSLERIESLKSGDDSGEDKDKTTGAQDREAAILHRWLSKDIRDTERRTIFVINYIDKITPYSSRGVYPKEIAMLITLVQKLIETVPKNNRLVMVALKDTMIPLEYYTANPKVALLEIPLPSRDERMAYFTKALGTQEISTDQLELLSNITSGLFVKDLENIMEDVASALREGPVSRAELKAIVNRYRIGMQDDPWASLPLEGPPKGLIDSAESWFRERVVGQDHAVREVVKALKKARAGVTGLATGQEAKPRATFFFAGPSGVGKTYVAKNLAEYLFDTQDAFIRFDMSEFKEEHTISKLIGSPPGYVGYEKGGELTNAVKSRPFTVVLFDEIEKAHPRIMDIFLQILDDGRLTDSRGQTVFFTESVIIFTSNLGTRSFNSSGKPVGEKASLAELEKIADPAQRGKAIRAHFVESVRNYFIYEISRPELLNRIGSHIVPFNFLEDSDTQERIIEIKLKDITANFRDKFSHQGFTLDYEPQVISYFKDRYGASIASMGGRGLVNAIDDEIAFQLAEQLLMAEKYERTGLRFVVTLNREGELVCICRQ